MDNIETNLLKVVASLDAAPVPTVEVSKNIQQGPVGLYWGRYLFASPESAE